MMNLLLLDISDPQTSSSIGVVEVAILAVLVLAITGLLIGGLVLFLVWRKRHSANDSGSVSNPAFNQSAQ
jgi:hypothetical protein